MADDDDASAHVKNPAAVEMGRKGGRKGGAIRASRMTPEQRAESARQAATARWAKAPPASDKKPSKGGRDPKPFVFKLLPIEAEEIMEAKGTGGQQSLHRRLVAELEEGNLEVTLNDRQFGELIRYMTRYGPGGFQDRLLRAFSRSFLDLFGAMFRSEHRP